MTGNDGRVFLAGIGNAFREDDGIGLYIARQVGQRRLPGVKAVEHQGEGLDLIEKWEGFRTVILVDAVSSGTVPGTVHRIQMPGQELSGPFEGCSTHAFSLAQTLALAKTLQRLPPRLILYGIEGASFKMGEGFSDAVRAAAGRVVEDVLLDISFFTQGRE